MGVTNPEVFAIKKLFKELTYTEQEEWKIDLKMHKEALAVLAKNLSLCYLVVWGQMSNALQNKV